MRGADNSFNFNSLAKYSYGPGGVCMQEKMRMSKDFMIPITHYPSINNNATLRQAVKMMCRMSKEKGYRWIIVLDNNNNITGFLTLRNVMAAISSSTSKAGGWLGMFTITPFFWEEVKSTKDKPVKNCFRPMVDVCVQETDNPVKAIELILNLKITIVPVINERKEVVGIIRPVDLLPFFKMLFDQ